MDSRTKLTLFLLCIVAVLATFLISTTTEKEDLAPQSISLIQTNSIKNILIERAGKDSIELSKRNNRWEITSPVRLNANPTRINMILQLPQANSFAQLKPDDINLSTLHLEKPETVLHLNDHTFSFGDTEALNDRRYILFNNVVHLIEDQLYHLLRQEPLFFANPKLLREDLALVEIIHPEYRLYKEDKWLLTTAKQTPVEGAEQLLDAWHKAMAVNIKAYSARESLGTILLNTNEGQTITFFIISREPALILARPDLGVEYHLDDYTQKQLLPNST